MSISPPSRLHAQGTAGKLNCTPSRGGMSVGSLRPARTRESWFSAFQTTALPLSRTLMKAAVQTPQTATGSRRWPSHLGARHLEKEIARPFLHNTHCMGLKSGCAVAERPPDFGGVDFTGCLAYTSSQINSLPCSVSCRSATTCRGVRSRRCPLQHEHLAWRCQGLSLTLMGTLSFRWEASKVPIDRHFTSRAPLTDSEGSMGPRDEDGSQTWDSTTPCRRFVMKTHSTRGLPI